MKSAEGPLTTREESYGQQGVTPVDRFGVWLSKRAIERVVAGRRGLAAVDLGCGYHATLLRSLKPFLRSGLGVDLQVSPEAKAEPGLSFIESTIDNRSPPWAMPRSTWSC